MKIKRFIKTQVEQALKPGLAIILLGARRVGKTTLIKEISDGTKEKVQFLNCDDPIVREKFSNIGLDELKRQLAPFDLIIFDEAQRIKNIGLTLKMIVDEMPTKKLLVSGSSSLELANEVSEPLTGRKKTFQLFPISFLELFQHTKQDLLATESYLDDALRFGTYPKVLSLGNEKDKIDYLSELAWDYLYKDALEYQQIKNPELIRKLLSALALQIGQEVSFPELASIVGVDQKTVMRYLDLLEKSFVIFRLSALNRNMRKEIAKSRKFYFYDLGIRNALIKNFNNYDIRADKGYAWENLLVIERVKRDFYRRERKNYYFWRTYDQKEVDFVEESGGKLNGFEFKWNKEKIKPAADFLSAYPNSEIKLINRDNFLDFVV